MRNISFTTRRRALSLIRISRRGNERVILAFEQVGKINTGEIIVSHPDDLDADGKPTPCQANRCHRGGESDQSRDACPEQLIGRRNWLAIDQNSTLMPFA